MQNANHLEVEISQSDSSQEPLNIEDLVYREYQKLNEHIVTLALRTERKSLILKYSNVSFSIIVIICGSILGCFNLAQTTEQSTTWIYVMASLGFIISFLEGIATTFALEKRGVLLKQVSLDLKALAQEMKFTELDSNLTLAFKKAKLRKYFLRLQKYHLIIYNYHEAMIQNQQDQEWNQSLQQMKI